MTVHLGFFSFHQPCSRCSLSRLFEKILKDVLCDRWSHGLNNQIGGRGKSAFGGGKQVWRWAGVPGCETWGLGTGAMDEAHAHQPCVPDTQALQESQFLTFPCQVHFLPEHGAEWGDWEVPATASCPDLSWEKKTSPPRSTLRSISPCGHATSTGCCQLPGTSHEVREASGLTSHRSQFSP